MVKVQFGLDNVNENKVADINVNGTNLFIVSKALQAYMSNTVKYADWKKNDATNALFAKRNYR